MPCVLFTHRFYRSPLMDIEILTHETHFQSKVPANNSLKSRNKQQTSLKLIYCMFALQIFTAFGERKNVLGDANLLQLHF